MVQMAQRQRFDPGGSKGSDMWKDQRPEPEAQVSTKHEEVKKKTTATATTRPRIELTSPEMFGDEFPPPGSPMNQIVVDDDVDLDVVDSRHGGDETRAEVDNECDENREHSSRDVVDTSSVIDLTDRIDPPATDCAHPTPWFGFDWTTAGATIGEAFSNMTDTNRSIKSTNSTPRNLKEEEGEEAEDKNPMEEPVSQSSDLMDAISNIRRKYEERVQQTDPATQPVLLSEEFTNLMSEEITEQPEFLGGEFNETQPIECDEDGSVECEIVDGKVLATPTSTTNAETKANVQDVESTPVPMKNEMELARDQSLSVSLKGTKSEEYSGEDSWEQSKDSSGQTSWERSRAASKDSGVNDSWEQSQTSSKEIAVPASSVRTGVTEEKSKLAEEEESVDETYLNKDPKLLGRVTPIKPVHHNDESQNASNKNASLDELPRDPRASILPEAEPVPTEKRDDAAEVFGTANTASPAQEETETKLEKEQAPPSLAKFDESPEEASEEPQENVDSGCACFCFPADNDDETEKNNEALELFQAELKQQQMEKVPVRSVLSSLFQCVDPAPTLQASEEGDKKGQLTIQTSASHMETTDRLYETMDDGYEEEDDEDPSTLLSATEDLQSLPSVDEDVKDTVPPYQAGDFGLSPKGSSVGLVESNVKKIDEKIESSSIDNASLKSSPSGGKFVGNVSTSGGQFGSNASVKSAHSVGRPIAAKNIKSEQSAEIPVENTDKRSVGAASGKSKREASPDGKASRSGSISPKSKQDGGRARVSVKADHNQKETAATEKLSMDPSVETRRAILVKELRSAIETFGRFDVRCASISAALGDVLVEAEEYKHAIKLHRDSVTIYSCKLGDDHTTTMSAKVRLAAVLESAGEIEEAISIYFQATSMRRAIFGDQDPSVADGLVCMAHALRKNGDYVPAIKELKRALKIFRESLGDSHEKVASTVDEIASLYVTIGDFTKSAAILEEVVKLKAATIGSKSKQVAVTLIQLANAYECSDKFDSAMKALKKAYKIYTEVVGYSSEEAAATLNRMAQLYEATDDYNRASVAYLGVLRGRKIQRGPDHLSVGETYFHLARALRETKQYDKSLKCLKEALPIFVGQGVEMNDVKMVADIMHEMALVSLERGHFQDASRILKQELSVRRKVGQPEFPFAARTLKHLGVTEYTMKNYSKALKYLVEALAIHQERDDQGTECGEVLFHTGLVFYKVGNKERALEAFVEAVRVFSDHGLDKYPLNIEANARIEEIRSNVEQSGLHYATPRRFNFAKRFGGKH